MSNQDRPKKGTSRRHRARQRVILVGTDVGNWLEGRSGMVSGAGETFNPLVPRRSRVLHTLGAALVASLAVEFATGLLMMTSYSPSSSTAWGSTFYLNNVITGGWFLRGLHGFSAHAMFIVGGLYLVGTLFLKLYKAPRELDWWLSLALLGMVIGFALTGNALVWDQDGYWAWHVETGIAGGAPMVGPTAQALIVGGTDLGNPALGRLYALHVGLLPLLTLFLLSAYRRLFRQHDHADAAESPETCLRAWPDQAFFNMLGSVLMIGTVAVLVVLRKGASLDAPADPSSFFPARPAWFFLWLYQLRKGFPGAQEVIATMIIPGALATVVALLPFFDRLFPKKLAHFLAIGFVFATIGGAGFLTVRCLSDDKADASYNHDLEAADQARDRAKVLAATGISPEGASVLLNHDPLYHGKPILETKCLGCHVYGGKGNGKQVAADLKDFGARPWIRGLLEKPDSPTYFGKVPGCDGMTEWKKNSKLDAKQLDTVADFVMLFTEVEPDLQPDEWLEQKEVSSHPGLELFVKECGECHVVEGLTEGGTRDAPQLYGWGSPQWIDRMIRKPAASDNYGYLEKDQQMPGFEGQLSENDRNTLVRYLRDDYIGAKLPVAGTLQP